MIHHEGTTTTVSIVATITSFITGAIPVLQALALIVSIVSGGLAIYGWIKRISKES